MFILLKSFAVYKNTSHKEALTGLWCFLNGLQPGAYRVGVHEGMALQLFG